MARPDAPTLSPAHLKSSDGIFDNDFVDAESVEQKNQKWLDIIRSEKRIQIYDNVPLVQIKQDSTIIDQNHVNDLVGMLKTDREQLLPVGLRAREEDGKVVFDIFDGYHRAPALEIAGYDKAKAVIVFGASEAELFDLRITAASSVKSVQFARRAEWMTGSWMETKWAKEGMTVTQAFGTAVNSTKNSRYEGIVNSDLPEIKAWVEAKCDKWGCKVSSLYQDLLIASASNPELVRAVRTHGGGGKDREARVTRDKLLEISNYYPGEENFNIQRLIMSFALQERLYTKEVERLCYELSTVITPSMDEGEIQELIIMFYRDKVQNVDLSTAVSAKKHKVEVREQAQRPAPSEPVARRSPLDMDHLADKIAREVIRKESLGIDDSGDDSIEANSSAVPRSRPGYSVLDPGYSRHSESRSGRGVGEDFESIRRERDDLRSAFEQMKDTDAVGWWTSATYLPAAEKGLLVDLFSLGKNINDVCRERKLSINSAESLLKSALIRRGAYLRSQASSVS